MDLEHHNYILFCFVQIKLSLLTSFPTSIAIQLFWQESRIKTKIKLTFENRLLRESLYHFPVLFGIYWNVIFQGLYKEGEEPPPPTAEIHINSFFLHPISDNQDPSCLSLCFQINKNLLFQKGFSFFPNFIHLQVFFSFWIMPLYFYSSVIFSQIRIFSLEY